MYLGSPLSQEVASCALEGRLEALGPGREALFPSSFQLLTRSEVVPASDAGTIHQKYYARMHAILS